MSSSSAAIASIDALWTYPVKSLRGGSSDDSVIESEGLQGDRQWLVVDETGHFVTQRQLPKMSLIRASYRDGHLLLQTGSEALRVAPDKVVTAGLVDNVTVWEHSVEAFDVGEVAREFLSRILGKNRGRDLRLFLRKEARHVKSKYVGTAQHPYYFADGFPFLVTTTGSLDDLKQRIAVQRGKQAADEITMERFRPNIVLRGLPPYAEDRVDKIIIKDKVELLFAKPCSRCVITMVDPDSGKKTAEPLPTLQTYRNLSGSAGEIIFGQNAVILRGAGEKISVGDTVEVVFRT